jgi:hypothetical protein
VTRDSAQCSCSIHGACLANFAHVQDTEGSQTLDGDPSRMCSISSSHAPLPAFGSAPVVLAPPSKAVHGPMRAPTSEEMMGSCHHSSRQSSASMMEVEDAVTNPEPHIVPTLPQKQVRLHSKHCYLLDGCYRTDLLHRASAKLTGNIAQAHQDPRGFQHGACTLSISS